MYMLFIDESGTPPPLGKANSTYFVLASLVIGEADWADIVAGVLFRKVEHGDNRYFSEIEPIIRKSSRRGIKGFGIIPIPDGRLPW